MAIRAGPLAVVVRSDSVSGVADDSRGVAETLIVAICAITVLASVGWLLQHDDAGVVGSNGVRPAAFVGALPARHEVCQTLGVAKRRPSTALVTLGTSGVGPQALRVRVPGRSTESLVSNYQDGVVSLPLPDGVAPNGGQLLCIKNRGQRDVQLGGESFPSAMVDRRIRPFAVSVTLTGTQRSWGAQANALFKRIGSARGADGSTMGWIICGLFGAAVFVALGAARRTAG